MPMDPFNVAFALTVATYHLPSGRTPHKVGIVPDLVLELDDETRADLALRSIYDKEWDWDPETDPHLAQALPLLRDWAATGKRPEIAPQDSPDPEGPSDEGGE